MQIIAIVAGIVALIFSHAASFEFGQRYGTESANNAWRKEINAANVKTEALDTELKRITRAKDTEVASVLASKEKELKDVADELETARNAQPLPLDCSRCFVDRRTLERVREARSPASDPKAGSPRASTPVPPPGKTADHVPAK
jgi:uncharacterized membrane protein